MDFLDDYVLEIDFPGRRVRFIDPKAYAIPERVGAADEGLLPFRRFGTRIGVEIELDGRRGDVLLDTGAPGNLLISGKFAKKLGIESGSLSDEHRVWGTTGPIAVRTYETDRFRLAGFDFGLMPILVAPKGWYNIAGPNDSVIGYDVLAQFVTRFDFEQNRIWLKRVGPPRVTQYGVDYALVKRVGATLGATEQSFFVYDVTPGGTADRFGIRVGDQILHRASDGQRPGSVDAVLEDIEKGTKLVVARPEGDVWIDVELPDADEVGDGPGAPGR